MKHMCPVPQLQAFSVPLLCCYGLGTSERGLRMGGISKPTLSHGHSSWGTSALQSTSGTC